MRTKSKVLGKRWSQRPTNDEVELPQTLDSQTIVCQKCGDTGYKEALLYCSICHTSAEHRYCLDTVLEDNRREIEWSCSHCAMMISAPQLVKRHNIQQVWGKKDKCKQGRGESGSHFVFSEKPMRHQTFRSTCSHKATVNTDVVKDSKNSAPQPVLPKWEIHESGNSVKELQIEVDRIIGPLGCAADGLGIHSVGKVNAMLVKTDLLPTERVCSVETHDAYCNKEGIEVKNANVTVDSMPTLLDVHLDHLKLHSSDILPSGEYDRNGVHIEENVDKSVQPTIQKDGEGNIPSVQISSPKPGDFHSGMSPDTLSSKEGKVAYKSSRKDATAGSNGGKLDLSKEKFGDEIEFIKLDHMNNTDVTDIKAHDCDPEIVEVTNGSLIGSDHLCGIKVIPSNEESIKRSILGGKEFRDKIQFPINHNPANNAVVGLRTGKNDPNFKTEITRDVFDVGSDHCSHSDTKTSPKIGKRVSGDISALCNTINQHSPDTHGNESSTQTKGTSRSVLDVISEHSDDNPSGSPNISGVDIGDNGNGSCLLKVGRSLSSSSGKVHTKDFTMAFAESFSSDNGSSNELPCRYMETLSSETLKTLKNCPPSMPTNGFQYPAKPLVEPIWSGSFEIHSRTYGPIMGHLSSRACDKAYDAARSLPPSLDLEQRSRIEIWPNSFKSCPPTHDSIALFFLPGTNRISQKYCGILNRITSQDLALRVTLHEAELLIFSSIELPTEYQSFHGNLYLWGAFRARQNPAMSSSVTPIFKGEIEKLDAVSLREPHEKNVVDDRQPSEDISDISNNFGTQTMLMAPAKIDEHAQSTLPVPVSIEQRAGRLAHHISSGNSMHTEPPDVIVPVGSRPCAVVDVGDLVLAEFFCTNMNSDGFWNFITRSKSMLRRIKPHLPHLLSYCLDPPGFALDILTKVFIPQDSKIPVLKGYDGFSLHLLESLCSVMRGSKTEPPRSFATPLMKQRAREIADDWKHNVFEKQPSKSTTAPYSCTFLKLIVTFGVTEDAEMPLYENFVKANFSRSEMPDIAVSLGLGHDFIIGFIQGLISKRRHIPAVIYIYKFGCFGDFSLVPLLQSCIQDQRNTARKEELHSLRTVVTKIYQFKLESEFPMDDLKARIQQLEHQVKKPSNEVTNRLGTPVLDAEPDLKNTNLVSRPSAGRGSNRPSKRRRKKLKYIAGNQLSETVDAQIQVKSKPSSPVKDDTVENLAVLSVKRHIRCPESSDEDVQHADAGNHSPTPLSPVVSEDGNVVAASPGAFEMGKSKFASCTNDGVGKNLPSQSKQQCCKHTKPSCKNEGICVGNSFKECLSFKSEAGKYPSTVVDVDDQVTSKNTSCVEPENEKNLQSKVSKRDASVGAGNHFQKLVHRTTSQVGNCLSATAGSDKVIGNIAGSEDGRDSAGNQAPRPVCSASEHRNHPSAAESPNDKHAGSTVARCIQTGNEKEQPPKQPKPADSSVAGKRPCGATDKQVKRKTMETIEDEKEKNQLPKHRRLSGEDDTGGVVSDFHECVLPVPSEDGNHPSTAATAAKQVKNNSAGHVEVENNKEQCPKHPTLPDKTSPGISDGDKQLKAEATTCELIELQEDSKNTNSNNVEKGEFIAKNPPPLPFPSKDMQTGVDTSHLQASGQYSTQHLPYGYGQVPLPYMFYGPMNYYGMTHQGYLGRDCYGRPTHSYIPPWSGLYPRPNHGW